METFTNSTLRILSPNGKTVGTGFLVSRDLVVTCAHVVVAADALEGDTIKVQITGQDEKLDALVEPKYWRDADKGDVAFLRLKTVPDGLTPLRLGLASQSRPGAIFHSYGYAKAADIQGIIARGTIDGYLPQHKLLQLQAPQANHGISGGPVLDEKRGVVVGMITKGHTELGRNEQTTFATPAELLFEICPDLRPSETCPYQGLATFTEETARFFFGREALAEKLLGALRSGCHFLAVFGPSGSGKSSVVRAGLLTALKIGQLPGSQKWAQFIMRPADNPFTQMQTAGLESLDIPYYLQSHPEVERVILFIDQFEELFTLYEDDLRDRFIHELTEALENSRLILIVSMRNEFFPSFTDKAEDLANSEHLKVENLPGVLKRDELVAMIERPAEVVGLGLEEGLAELILKDLTRDGEARSSTLPLLEFALTQMWEKRLNGMLTHEAYQTIGGVTGSLARWADDAYCDLPKADQPLVESLLTSLVRLGDEAQGLPDTRRQRVLTDFDEQTMRIVRRFADRRLLITSDEIVELVHDALVREWGRFQGWLKHDRENLHLREVVGDAARQWEAGGKDESLLNHRGARLELAITMGQLPVYRLNLTEQMYLDACTKLREKEKALVVRRWRLAIVGVSIALAIIIAVLAGWGWTSYKSSMQLAAASTSIVSESNTRATAELNAVNAKETAQANEKEALQQATMARAGELAAQAVNLRDKNFQLSLLLSVAAYKTADTPQARSALLANTQISPQLTGYFVGHTGSVLNVSFSPDGKTIASASSDKSVILWDAATRRPIGKPLKDFTGWVYCVAFSPDGKILATGSDDKTITLWDVETHQKIGQPLLGHTDSVGSVSFSPDGKILASRSRDKTIIFWDIQTHEPIGSPLKMQNNVISAIAFSPNGKIFASASDKAITLWDVATRQPIGQPLLGDIVFIHSVAFSPDGKTIVSAGCGKEENLTCVNGKMTLWDVATFQTIGKPYSGHTGGISSVVFSPNGKMLASSGQDKSIIIWDVANHRSAIRIPPFTEQTTGDISTVAFSPNGKTLASGSATNVILLWDLSIEQPISQSLQVIGDGVEGFAFSPDGKILATGTGMGSSAIILWDTETYKPIGQPLLGHGKEINGLAFSPDGKILASASSDKTIILWDVETRKLIGESLKGHTGSVLTVAFRPDGKILASGSSDNTIILWDLSTRQPIDQPLLGSAYAVNGIAFSPDGKILVSAGFDDLILWDVETQKPIDRSIKPPWGAFNVAMSPNGKIIASANKLGSTSLWDLATHQLISEFFAPSRIRGLGSVQSYITNSVAFSPDGNTLASGNVGGTLTLWDVPNRQPIGLPLSLFGMPSNQMAFSPDNMVLVSGGGANEPIMLWNLSPQFWAELSCRRISRNFTRDEWEQYFPNETYPTKQENATCPQWPLEPEPTLLDLTSTAVPTPTEQHVSIATVVTPTFLPEKILTTVQPVITSTPTPVPQVYNPHPALDDYFDTQGVPMRMVPSGEFAMGSEKGETAEKPVHTVSLGMYTIDKYEVTNALYATCVNAGKCDAPGEKRSSLHNIYYDDAKFENYPVIYVDWNKAKAYCEWRGARLPTEAEWEKAAHGSSARSENERTYPWGEGIDTTRANYNQPDTTMVGSYESGQSPFGLYDMAGNVWEWTADWYNVYPGGDPTGNRFFGQSYRVVRGGAWTSIEYYLRVSFRYNVDPDYGYSAIGFRCVH